MPGYVQISTMTSISRWKTHGSDERRSMDIFNGYIVLYTDIFSRYSDHTPDIGGNSNGYPNNKPYFGIRSLRIHPGFPCIFEVITFILTYLWKSEISFISSKNIGSNRIASLCLVLISNCTEVNFFFFVSIRVL